MFLPGIDVLLRCHSDWLRGRRIGLISHQAALGANGVTSAQMLHDTPGIHLAALFGPEHGFFGTDNAGEPTRSGRHGRWGIPIHSLYGATRRPTPAMLRGLDVLVFDLQDLGVRCYTYVSTLRLALEAAAEAGLRFIVADRPVPLPHVVDGPVLDPRFESFVAAVPGPLCLGMTPGETARWLVEELDLHLDLRVARLQGYRRQAARGADWPPWIPPSPGIASWESAACYPATVFTEALPAVWCGRRTSLPFQLLAVPSRTGLRLVQALEQLRLPGLDLHPHRFQPTWGEGCNRAHDGLRLVVSDPVAFRPAHAGVAFIHAIQKVVGWRQLWSSPGTRPEWFDKLYGTDSVRLALQAGESPEDVARSWTPGLRRFAAARRACLLYPTEEAPCRFRAFRKKSSSISSHRICPIKA